MSPLIERLGPVFDFPEIRRKLRVVPFVGMKGESEFNICTKWDADKKQYIEIEEKVTVRPGDIYDSILVDTGKGVMALLALQLGTTICSLAEDTITALVNEETARQKFWFWLQEI